MNRRLTPAELEDVVRRAVLAAGLEEHQYIAVRHSEQEHEHPREIPGEAARTLGEKTRRTVQVIEVVKPLQNPFQ